VTISSNAWLAGSLPIEHLVPSGVGQSVNCGDRIVRVLAVALALTPVAGTVLQTQIE
jgi:hypothetical protein